MIPSLPDGAPASPQPAQAPLKPGWIGVVVVYLGFAAVLLRTFDIEASESTVSRILGGEGFFIFLYTIFLWKYRWPRRLMYLYFAFQAGLVVWILSQWPDFDFITVYFIILSYQASLVFSGRLRWTWVGAFSCIMCAALMVYHGILNGLALSLTNVVASIIIPAYLMVNHEIEQARRRSQQLLANLQTTHQELETYAGQVEELTAIQERNRLARELHDSVSQMIFSISLTTRSAQLLLEKDPTRLPEQLDGLQTITSAALAQLRSLITQLRPPPS